MEIFQVDRFILIKTAAGTFVINVRFFRHK